MGATFPVDGLVLSEKQVAMLRQLAVHSVDMEHTTGHEDRVLNKLEEKDLAAIETTIARITNRGQAILAKLAGAAPTTDTPPTVARSLPDRPGRGATQRTLPEGSGDTAATTPAPSSGPSGVFVDLAKLRAQIDEQYRLDISALAQVAGIAAATEGE